MSDSGVKYAVVIVRLSFCRMKIINKPNLSNSHESIKWVVTSEAVGFCV